MTRTMMILLGLAGFGLAGCNTVEGMGEDIQAGGAVLTETADETGDEIEEVVVE